jgi:hypothetical protein
MAGEILLKEKHSCLKKELGVYGRICKLFFKTLRLEPPDEGRSNIENR